MITLWGPSSAGKTALLSYLFLRANAVERDWKIFPTEGSLEQILQQSQRIMRENEFPEPTKNIKDIVQELSYKFLNKATGEIYVLETRDRAGRSFVQEGIAARMDPEALDGLNAAEGIVLFLDYGRGQRETEVIDALNQMYVRRSAGRVEQDGRPLAVCLSKVDQLVKQPEDYKRLLEEPEQFVRARLSKELLRWIDQFHSVVKFFPVSSVGLQLSFGTLQKSVFFDERLMLRVTARGTPINIVEPFIWIFEKLREVS
jgi:hypothetical protein